MKQSENAVYDKLKKLISKLHCTNVNSAITNKHEKSQSQKNYIKNDYSLFL